MENNAWDKNAKLRHQQVVLGKDFSFSEIVSPVILSIAKKSILSSKANVLDVGCGTGILTYKLSKIVKRITGIDSSRNSIKIASKEYKEQNNLRFVYGAIENYDEDMYSMIVSNMAFQSISNISHAIKQISRITLEHGILVFSIPHPCFWEFHRSEIRKSNYRYKTPSQHSLLFTITNDPKPLPSPITYHHRSIEFYGNLLSKHNFYISNIFEPTPNKKHFKEHNISWEYPRYIILKCIKNKGIKK